MRVAYLQEQREGTPGALEIAKEEELLQAILSTNQTLVDVFKYYDYLGAVANAEMELMMNSCTEQMDASMVRSFRPW
jgi:hypothetical protein